MGGWDRAVVLVHGVRCDHYLGRGLGESGVWWGALGGKKMHYRGPTEGSVGSARPQLGIVPNP